MQINVKVDINKLSLADKPFVVHTWCSAEAATHRQLHKEKEIATTIDSLLTSLLHARRKVEIVANEDEDEQANVIAISGAPLVRSHQRHLLIGMFKARTSVRCL